MRWKWIQALYDTDPIRHHAAASAGEDGLVVPLEVFEQVFHEHYGDRDFEARVRDVDWTPIAWDSITMSGSQLRQMGVPRTYQFAVDEARAFTVEEGLHDDRSSDLPFPIWIQLSPSSVDLNIPFGVFTKILSSSSIRIFSMFPVIFEFEGFISW